jgi:hypothetical protein
LHFKQNLLSLLISLSICFSVFCSFFHHKNFFLQFGGPSLREGQFAQKSDGCPHDAPQELGMSSGHFETF